MLISHTSVDFFALSFVLPYVGSGNRVLLCNENFEAASLFESRLNCFAFSLFYFSCVGVTHLVHI